MDSAIQALKCSATPYGPRATGVGCTYHPPAASRPTTISSMSLRANMRLDPTRLGRPAWGEGRGVSVTLGHFNGCVLVGDCHVANRFSAAPDVCRSLSSNPGDALSDRSDLFRILLRCHAGGHTPPCRPMRPATQTGSATAPRLGNQQDALNTGSQVAKSHPSACPTSLGPRSAQVDLRPGLVLRLRGGRGRHPGGRAAARASPLAIRSDGVYPLPRGRGGGVAQGRTAARWTTYCAPARCPVGRPAERGRWSVSGAGGAVCDCCGSPVGRYRAAALQVLLRAPQDQMRVTALKVGQHPAYRWLLHHAARLISRNQHGVILQHGSDIAPASRQSMLSSWAGDDMDAMLLGRGRRLVLLRGRCRRLGNPADRARRA